MNGDVQRDQLAAALREKACPCDPGWGHSRWDHADVRMDLSALLPVVRKIAADELRAAADEARGRAARMSFEAKVHMQHEARLLDRSADELDPS